MEKNIEDLRLYCLSKRKATECFPFDEENLVFKVETKMFAVINLNNPDWIILKCDPDYAIDLRDKYDAIEPAFHFNKRYWIQVNINSGLSADLILKLIDHSYEEVLKKFTRKMRDAYNAD